MKRLLAHLNSLLALSCLILLAACNLPFRPTETSQPPPNMETLLAMLPTPTASPEAISDQTIQQVSAEDVLREIAFPGGGVGFKSCEKKDAAGYQGPVFEKLPAQIGMMEMPTILSCGWSRDEKVQLTIIYPDGRRFSRTYQAGQHLGSDACSILPEYQVSIEDPPGIYTLIEQGAQTTIQATVEYLLPPGPRLFLPYQDPFNPSSAQNRLVFYGFAPGESVRLYIYRNTPGSYGSYPAMILSGQQDFRMGPDGRLAVNVLIEPAYYLAVGDVTGEVHQWRVNIMGTLSAVAREEMVCPGAKASRVSAIYLPGVRVANRDGAPLAVYRAPGLDQEVIANLNAGTEMAMSGYNRCVNGVWWWKVYESSTAPWKPTSEFVPPVVVFEGTEQKPPGTTILPEGWVPETDGDDYLIEPIRK